MEKIKFLEIFFSRLLLQNCKNETIQSRMDLRQKFEEIFSSFLSGLSAYTEI